MTLEIIMAVAVLAAVVLFFITGWIKLDVVPLLIPVALIVTGLVDAGEVFSGFSSSAVITVASLFVITSGLVRSGVVNRVADTLSRVIQKSKSRLMVVGTLVPGLFAGFIIVTATVLFFIPAVMRMALQLKVSRSKILLPMVASCLLGANITLIGASHNLVTNSMAEELLGHGFSFFEFLPAGLILLFLSVVYNSFVGWRLLPGNGKEEPPPEEEKTNLIKTYDLVDRLWELWVEEGSMLTGKNIREARMGEVYGVSLVAAVHSGDYQGTDSGGEMIFRENDVMLVLGREDKVRELAENEGLFFSGHPREQNKFPLSRAELVEIVVPPRSSVIGKTLIEIDFRKESGLSVIALWRDGRPYRTSVGSMILREGDGLLLFGDRNDTRSFRPGKDFRWLHPPRKEQVPPELKPLGPLALLILLAVIATAAFKLIPVSVAAVTGAAAMVLSGILKPREIYSSIDWKIIILIGCLYPLGIALNNSGASALLAEQLLAFSGGSIYLMLAAIGLITILLTQPLHNVAAAVIMVPVAINAAAGLGVNPKTFLMAVIIGASASFMMPTGHPAPMIIQSTGNYRPQDYLKYGAGLCTIVLAVIIFIIPRFWPA